MLAFSHFKSYLLRGRQDSQEQLRSTLKLAWGYLHGVDAGLQVGGGEPTGLEREGAGIEVSFNNFGAAC